MTARQSIVAIAVVAGTWVPAALQAQVLEPLTSNRPGIGESEALMPRGVVQFETGLSFSRGDGATSVTTPELWVRYGATRRVEVFGVVPGLVWERAGGTSLSGASDAAVHLKVGLAETAAGAMLSVAAGTTLPTGAAAFSSGRAEPSVRVLWALPLPNEFSIAGNVGVSRVGPSDGRQTVGALSSGISRAWTETTSWFGEIHHSLEAADTTTANGGVAIVIGDNQQIDLSAGRTVRGGSGWFVSAGFTIRSR